MDIAVAREGNSFLVYDYKTGDASRYLSRADVNSLLESAKQSGTVTVESENSLNISENSENSVKNSGNSLSPSARMAKVGARRASVLSRRRADMTVGQMRQMIARYTGDKVYTSKEARETMKIELQKPSMQAILRLTSSFFSAIIKCKT